MNRGHDFRVSIWLCSVMAVTASAHGQHAVKVPQLPPIAEDVKTTAAAPVTGESRMQPAPARPADLPASSPTQRVSHAGASTRRQHLDHVQVAESGDGSIWVHGAGYKARFAADGVTYVPFFGSRAAANHPVRFALVGARVGASAIDVDVNAVPRLSDEHVAFERGGLVERWRLALGEVEQQFVIESLPASGDVVIDVAVETDLVPAVERDTLAFGCDLGRVEYGAAVAIDADGRRFPLERTWNGTTIGLRLAGADVGRLRFPLVVDPIVSTTTFDSSLLDDFAPDTAYLVSTDSHLVVYEESFSAADHDVYALHLDALDAPLYGGYLDYTTDDWRHPRVASNVVGQNFLCVAAVTPVAGGQRIIRGATFTAATNTPGAQFTISGGEPGNKLNPDVGGDPSSVGPTYYMVVWQRDYSASDKDVHARLVQPSGTTVGGVIFVDNSTGTIDTVPAISKSDGNPPFPTQVWTMVWQRFYFGTQEQVWGAQYRWDGALVNSTFGIDTGDDCLAPSVSSVLDGDAFYPRNYMVAFQVKGQQQTQWDILGAVFAGTQFQTGTDVGQQGNPATSSSDQVHPRVDSDGEHFSVTWAEEFVGGFYDWDIFVSDLVYAAGYAWVCTWDRFAATSLQDMEPSITSCFSGGGARRRYMGTWTTLDQFTPGAVHEVWTGLWDGCEGGFATAFCAGDGSATACPCANFGSTGSGCGNVANAGGGNLWYAGNPWIGNDTFTLVGTGMPDSPVLYFQGDGLYAGFFGAVFGNGLRCAGGTTQRLGIKFNVGGASQFPEAGDPTISSYVIMLSTGAYYYYQAWYRDGASFCTSAGFNLTNGLRAIWAP